MFRRIAVAALAVSLTTAAVAAAGSLRSIDKAHFKIDAEAKPALGAFSGQCNEVSAKEEGGKITFTAELKRGLKMGLRDKHTREAFRVDKHPVAKLVIERSKLKIPGDKEKLSGDVTGALTLHGVTKPVKVSYKVVRTGSDFHVKDAKFSFNYTDFGVEKICKLGVCVEPKVTITVDHLKLREQ